MLKKITLLALLAGFSFCCPAEPLGSWTFEKRKPKGLSYPAKTVSFQVPGSIRTPDDQPCGEFKLSETAPNASAWSIQINFASDQQVSTGTKYRVSFFLQGEPAGEIGVSCSQGKAPWKTIGTSGKTLRFGKEWVKAEFEFTAKEDYTGPLRTPMLMAGQLPAGTVLRIGPVTLEKMKSALPLSLNPSWTVFSSPNLAGVSLDRLTAIPQTLGGAKAQTVSLTENTLDLTSFNRTFKEKTPAVLFNEFTAPEDGTMQIGCSADYWFEFLVNGKCVYDTLLTGNRVTPTRPADHVFNFPVRKGKNLIVVKVLSGSKGWKFICGPVSFREKINRITEIRASREWRPIKMDQVEWKNITPQRIDQFKIIPGSALDLSRQFPQFDIDRNGRLVATKEGELVFENASSEPVRLRGFNFTPGSWQHHFFAMSHKEIEELTEQIRLHGMNLLRIHFLDMALTGKNGLPKQGKDRKFLHEVPMNLTPETLPIDKAFLDRFDYFVKCCRDRGIYLMPDLMTDARGAWTTAVQTPDMRESMRYGLMISDQYRKHWKAGAEFLINHVNPYTGKKLFSDYQCIGITFLNEQEHLFSAKSIGTFTPEWRKFRNPEHPEQVRAFNMELLTEQSEEGDAARNYLRGKIAEMNRFYLDAAKEFGFKGLVTQWDMFMRNLEGDARSGMSVVAMHTYFAHPNQTELSPADYPQKLTYGSWFKGKMDSVAQSSSIAAKNSYLGRAAATRVPEKPFLMTEYSHTAYNRFSHEAGLMMGAYAALQGWNALTPHANTVELYYEPLRSGSFDNGINQMANLSSLLTAFAWQRGDVATAKHLVNYRIGEDVLKSPNLMAAIGSGYSALFMLTKIGATYTPEPVDAALEIKPEYFSGVKGMNMYATLGAERAEQDNALRNLVATLKEKKILPPGNRTNVAAGIFQSETGEITADTEHNTMTVVSPRLEGAVLKKDQPVKLDALEIVSASIPCSISAISLDKNQTLSRSGDILLVVGTMAVAEGAVFSTESFHEELDVGGLQLLYRSGKFVLKLKTAQKKAPKVYALNLNGSRECEIPATFDNGTLLLTLDTTALKYGTPYFEIVY